MKKIFLIILFSCLGFIFNEEIFFNVTNDNYKNTFENLKIGNIYNFIFPAIPFENVYFALATNKTNYYFPNLNIYNYISYSSNYSERNKQQKPYSEFKEIKGEFTFSYVTYLNDSNSEYLGIQLTMQKSLNYLTLTIITKNVIEFKSYNVTDKRKLFAFIPYYYFYNVNNNKKFRLQVYLKSMSNLPFKEFYLTEYDQDNRVIKSSGLKAESFYWINRIYLVHEVEYKEKTKKISYDFILDYDIEDFEVYFDIPDYDKPKKENDIDYGFILLIAYLSVNIFFCVFFCVFYYCQNAEISTNNREFQYQPQNKPLINNNN